MFKILKNIANITLFLYNGHNILLNGASPCIFCQYFTFICS